MLSLKRPSSLFPMQTQKFYAKLAIIWIFRQISKVEEISSLMNLFSLPILFKSPRAIFPESKKRVSCRMPNDIRWHVLNTSFRAKDFYESHYLIRRLRLLYDFWEFSDIVSFLPQLNLGHFEEKEIFHFFNHLLKRNGSLVFYFIFLEKCLVV